MKKRTLTLTVIFLIFSILFCEANAFGKETTKKTEPILQSISFKDAKIEGKFSSKKYEYNLILDNPDVMPTLEDYKIKGNANLFITKETDKAGNQIGIIAKISFDDKYTSYTFDFKNGNNYKTSTNCYLKSISCDMCDISPKLNHKDTDYTLYVPSEITSLKLNVQTEDANSTTDTPKLIKFTQKQELDLAITVTSTSSLTRLYKIHIKRMNMSSSEIKEVMKKKGFTSTSQVRTFKNKTIKIYIFLFIILLLIILFLMFKIGKRLSVKLEEDKLEFFDLE